MIAFIVSSRGDAAIALATNRVLTAGRCYMHPVHVRIRLRRDAEGYPPFESEEVDATEAGDHLFSLEVAPAFANGLARGDVVRVGHYGSDPWVEALNEASGHSTVRVISLGMGDIEVPRSYLETLGCTTFGTPIEGMIAIDIPPGVDFDAVRDYLTAGQAPSAWDFNVGVRGDGRAL